MGEEDFEKQVVAVRSGLPVAAKHFDARDVERVAFDVAGQAEALMKLSPREQERVVALRTAALAFLAAQGDRRLDVDETTLAGGVIISAFLSKWNPYLKDE